MKADRWSQIEGLFLQVVEIAPEQRERFLNDVCQGDESLRQEINSLLACDVPETPLVKGSFLPANSAPSDVASVAIVDMAGRRIGPYRLVRLLGRGGMGSVHLAVRDDAQFQKEVAIKLLKRGMDTDFMLQRFRQERQILASLEHPFIAHLLDGGATDEGLPYFVMEYVDGLPITRYCAEQNLDLSERLRLFRLVCEAVQYAHQHLVIHRDLKPSNILITRERIPKLLDFGIAKLINAERPAEMATITGPEQRMLTPDYASPEQFLGQRISTSSDIYSLGAVLYELLTEQRPHHLNLDSLAAMEKAICEEEPEKPSFAVRRGVQDSLRVLKQRSRQLSGDLDNIVLTALRKEPQRRYPSVSELSEDIRRHMEGLPVTAREDRLTYRLGKFIRRNKLAVGAVTVLLVILSGGILSTTFQARRADRRFQLVRQLANKMLFDLHDQAEKLPGTTALQASMVQTVVQYLDNLAKDSGGDPTLDLEIAKAYRRAAAVEGHPFRSNLGLNALARDHFRKAQEILERLASQPQTKAEAVGELIDTHTDLASVEEVLGNPSAVVLHLEKAASMSAQLSSLGGKEIHPSSLLYLYFRLGDVESQRGNWDAELGYYRKAIEACQRWVAAERSPEALNSLRSSYSHLAKGQFHAGDLYAAQDNFRLALKVSEELMQLPGGSSIDPNVTVGIYHVFGDMLAAPDDPNLGKPAEALSLFRAAAELNARLVKADAQDANARRNLAGSYRRVGLMLLATNPAEAFETYQKAFALSSELSSADTANIHHRSSVADALLGMGQALHRLGKNEEAIQKLTRALELEKSIETVAPERIFLLRTLSRTYMEIGNVMLAQGNGSQALESYHEGLAIADRSLQRVTSSLNHSIDRADLLEALGRYYLASAEQPGINQSRRSQLMAEAKSWFQKDLDVWQDWSKRKVAIPFAARREAKAHAWIASCNQP
jgi:eukaryotic-like serine/threonine-protein kinase